MSVLAQFLDSIQKLDTRQRAQLISSMGTAAEITYEAGLTTETNVLVAFVILVAEIEVVQAEEFERFAAGHDDGD